MIRSRLIRSATEKRSDYGTSGSTGELLDGERRLLWRVILQAVFDWSAKPGIQRRAGPIEARRQEAESFLFGQGLEDYCSVLGVSASGLRRRLKRIGRDGCLERFREYAQLEPERR